MREQTEDDAADAAAATATVNVEGVLGISGDEDIGGDPYNHTGRFERLVR